jgi:hypothetical protein
MSNEQLYVITKDDVNSVLETSQKIVTDEQREACYDAVRDLDSSHVFEQIEAIVMDKLS